MKPRATAAPLSIELLETAPPVLPEDALACIEYGTRTAPAPAPDEPRRLALALPPLGARRVELWRTPAPVEIGSSGAFGYARGEDILFGQWQGAEAGTDFEALTREAYAAIHGFIAAQGYPELIRIWNYFPRITGRDGDIERYRAFCLGRFEAIEGIPDFEQHLPAATAIGTGAAGFAVFFIAARSPGQQIENPRQVSAFRYPEQYSPRSPSFSRATLSRLGGGVQLHVSGTASIVGHESRHAGDVEAQLDEVLRNLQALMAAAGTHEPSLSGRGLTDLAALKVYVRRPEDQPGVAALLEARLAPLPPVLYLRGDVCRDELDVEIEAVYTGAP
jgi:chorismate lyase/3-hydroxybenzoate synthase